MAHSETSTDDGDPELTGPDGGSGSEGAGGGKKKHVDSPVNWPVFGTAAGLIIAFVLWAWLAPHSADTVINNVKDWIATNLGWFYVLTAGVVVVFVLVIAFRRTGNTKIGPDHSQPKFGLFTWGAMLFAAGIGVDLMFFGISGPATNYLTPPEGAGMSDEAARMAPLWTMFHYGIPGWAMYALMGMAFGLFAYRYHMPLSIRSALAPIFGRRIHGAPGHAVEIAASIGTAFGISVSLGIGVVFINYGLSELFGIPTSTGVQIALICLSVFITILSTVSGVDKGIRRLSELNVWLAVILMVWIVVMGKTADLLNSLVQNIGDFVSRFPSMMLNTFSYSEGSPDYPAQDWMSDWTLFFWAWWIAWAPFVGLFLARISRGRTVRQFVVGVLVIPFTFIAMWISIFGNAALSFFRDGDEEFLKTAVDTPESGFFLLLQQYPGATFAVALAVVTGLLFYVTSADSGSLVMATMTSKSSKDDSDGPPWLRIVWAVITGALTLVMLLIGGVYTLQSATVLIGLPFAVVMYLIMLSVWRVLTAERHSLESREMSRVGALLDRAGDTGPARLAWRRRLRRRMSFPSAAETEKYLEETAAPAIEEVAAELKGLGLDVTCHRGTHPDYPISYVDLVVQFPHQDEFKYEAYPVAAQVPNFAVNLNVDEDVYYTLEIFSATGSRGHDILGYTKDQVIADVLDAYDAHVEYMELVGDKGTPTGEAHTPVPEFWGEDGEVTDDNITDETTDETTAKERENQE
ncbi:MAG TPA: high-affinity choline transporter BetT [Corynebacterium nuruki]|uniref:High-affinity choline transporter BetT n=1 Tax=Corynebacterium nuruki TaxID=1032851 RepID=A0A3D4T098_9CORY|nr:high-affinity choline transporter BetT [Corynebacterium nuruki]